jgi:hypothetical protein
VLLFDSELLVHAWVTYDDSRPRECICRISERVRFVSDKVTAHARWLQVDARDDQRSLFSAGVCSDPFVDV